MIDASRRDASRARSSKIISLAALLSALLVLLGLATACQETPGEHLRQAQAAVRQGDADAAERHLKQALDGDASLLEAKRGLVRVHMLRKDFPKAEEALLALWTAQGFDKPGARDTVDRLLVRQLFTELYRTWAATLNPADNPEKYREILDKALTRDPKDADLHKLLVAFYQREALQRIERGDRRAAAEAYEAILALRPFPKTRREAIERARELRIQLFDEEAAQRFDETLKPALVKAERFDPVRKTITLEIEGRADRAPKTARGDEKARASAAAQLRLDEELVAIVRALGPFAQDVEIPPMADALKEDVKRLDTTSRARGVVTWKVSVPLGALIAQARALKLKRGELLSDTLARRPADGAVEGLGEGQPGGETRPNASPDMGAPGTN